jgi:hypothetical protein
VKWFGRTQAQPKVLSPDEIIVDSFVFHKAEWQPVKLTRRQQCDDIKEIWFHPGLGVQLIIRICDEYQIKLVKPNITRGLSWQARDRLCENEVNLLETERLRRTEHFDTIFWNMNPDLQRVAR